MACACLNERVARTAGDEEVGDAVAPVEDRVALHDVLLADDARVAAREQRRERRDELEVQVEVHAAELVEHEVPDHVRLLQHVRVRLELLVQLVAARALLEVLAHLRACNQRATELCRSRFTC